MYIKRITYCEPNMSQPDGEREYLEQTGYVVVENNVTISPILDTAEEADEWYDEQQLLALERGD